MTQEYLGQDRCEVLLSLQLCIVAESCSWLDVCTTFANQGQQCLGYSVLTTSADKTSDSPGLG